MGGSCERSTRPLTLTPIVLLLVVLAACGSSSSLPSATPTPAGSIDTGSERLGTLWTLAPAATPTPSPTATPRPTPTPAAATPQSTPTPMPRLADRPAPLRPDGIGVVRVTELLLRSKPSTASGSTVVGHLTEEDRVFVVDGPVEASGYTWYLLDFLDRPVWGDSGASFGWAAAASRTGETWLEGRELVCPAEPIEITTLAAMTPYERLSCFGSRTLTFEAMGTAASYDDLWGNLVPWGKPEWLNDLEDKTYAGAAAEGLGFGVRFPPSVERPADWHGRWFRLTGHFDDPASKTCRGGMRDLATGAIDSDEDMSLDCRLHFVVTTWVAVHRVAFGDTLSGIADRYGVSVAALRAANPQVSDPSVIYPGDFLTLPPAPAS